MQRREVRTLATSPKRVKTELPESKRQTRRMWFSAGQRTQGEQTVPASVFLSEGKTGSKKQSSHCGECCARISRSYKGT